jgi:hypothetical protein
MCAGWFRANRGRTTRRGECVDAVTALVPSRARRASLLADQYLRLPYQSWMRLPGSMIDPAVCRPGRFDYHIEVPSPDQQGRAAILRVCLATMRTRPVLRLEALAEATAGSSGAELAGLCRESGLDAIQWTLAQGIAARQVVVCGQDLRHAFAAFWAKRVPAGPLAPEYAAAMTSDPEPRPVPRAQAPPPAWLTAASTRPTPSLSPPKPAEIAWIVRARRGN